MWDPGGPGPPILPLAVATGLKIGAECGAPGDGDQAAAAWVRMPAAGCAGPDRGPLSRFGWRFRWLAAAEWMHSERAPYLPAWDPDTRELVQETGMLTAAPHVPRMVGAMQGDVLWDVMYSKVRADLHAVREIDAREAGVYYRVTREMITERVRAMHARPPRA